MKYILKELVLKGIMMLGIVISLGILSSAVTVHAAEGDISPVRRKIGKFTLEMDSKGILTMSGKGEFKIPYDASPENITNGKRFEIFEKNVRCLIIKEGVTKIGDFGFDECPLLERVILPEGIRGLGFGAFEGCRKLTDINIPNSLKEVDWAVFKSCGFKSFKIPKHWEEIPSHLLSYCPIRKVEIPDGIKVIGNEAFRGCSNLREIKMPDTLERIEHEAFIGCSRLSQISFPSTLRVIGCSAFAGCCSLKKVILPNSVRVLQGGAFRGCTSLRSIRLSRKMRGIKGGTFANNTSLRKIVIPPNITHIGNCAFRECTSLREIYVRTKKLKDETCGFSITYTGIESCVLTLHVPKGKRKEYTKIFSDHGHMKLNVIVQGKAGSNS